MAATLDDAWAKVEWAHGHLKRLQEVMQRFHDEKGYVVTEEFHPQGTSRILTAKPKPVPPDVPFILGDIVHALHSALDYVVCSLVESSGKPVSKAHAWPIFFDRDHYNAKAPKMLRYVPYQAINLIESLQPYNVFGYELGILYGLSIEEKHRALLVTTSVAFPQYVAHNRTDEETSGIHFRFPSTDNEAQIELPIDPERPNEHFDYNFTAKVTLAQDGPEGPSVEDVARAIYNDVAHQVFTKVRWLNLLRLTFPRELPFVY